MQLSRDSLLESVLSIGSTNAKGDHALAVDSHGLLWLATDSLSATTNTSDILMAQFSQNGSLIQALSWSGDADDRIHSLAIDSQGSIWVLGDTQSLSAQKRDVLALKFEIDGNLTQALYWGGGNDEYGRALAIDDQDTVWISGRSDSFNTTGDHVFVLRLNASGNLILAKQWEVPYKSSYAISLDSQGELSLGGTEFLMQGLENISSPFFSSSYSALVKFTDILNSTVAIDITAHAPTSVTSDIQSVLSTLSNSTIDLTVNLTLISMLDQLSTREYPLNYVAPLYQIPKVGEAYALEILSSGATFNESNGVQVSQLPEWLQFNVSTGKLTGERPLSERKQYKLDLVVKDPRLKQWHYQMLIGEANHPPSYSGETSFVSIRLISA